MRRNDTAVKAAASALGLGHLPVAPGTWASAGAALVYLLVQWLDRPVAYALLAALFVGVVVLGLAVCPRAIEVYGDKDPGPFVLDEVAGYWLTCLAFHWSSPLATAVSAFVAFRFFDIVKPFPIKRLERIPGAWGVMLDDLAAGVYSAALLWVVFYVGLPMLGR